MKRKIVEFLVRQSAIVFLVLILAGCAIGNPFFLKPENLFNILTQASPTIILASGMTFVLLIGGVDLSVGSVMYAGAAVAATLIFKGFALPVALAAFIAVGILFGILNAFFIARLRVMPFVVTLAMLFIARGVGHTITGTRAMNLPEKFLEIGSAKLWLIPVPVLIAGVTVVVLELVLARTVFGRHVYAVGHDPEMARKAGMRPARILTVCYVVAGFTAALAGILALSQLGSVAPNFGFEREFIAISAAVIGGTSLFGGRGRVIPGAVIGAVILQAAESGLVVLNVDPYLYPVIYSGIIFFAVVLDTFRRNLESNHTI